MVPTLAHMPTAFSLTLASWSSSLGLGWISGGVVTFLLGVGVLALAYRVGLPALGARRTCPWCAYDMEGLPDAAGGALPACPECGRAARSEAQLRVGRRRLWARLGWATLGVLLLLASWMVAHARPTLERGWIGAAPSTALLAWQTMVDERLDSVAHEELCERFNEGRMAQWQERSFVRWRAAQTTGIRSVWPEGSTVFVRAEASTFLGKGMANCVLAEFPDARTLTDPRQYSPSYFDFWRPSEVPVATRTVDGEEFVERRLASFLGSQATEPARLKGPGQTFDDPVPIRRVATLDEAITPVDSVATEKLLRNALRGSVRRLANHPASIDVQPLWQAAATAALQPEFWALLPKDFSTIALRIEVRRDGVTLGEALWRSPVGGLGARGLGRGFWRRDWGRQIAIDPRVGDDAKAAPLDALLTSALDAFAAGDTTALDAWSVRVVGDGELALRDFDATHYWRGSFVMPLRELVERPPAAPAAPTSTAASAAP